MSDRTMWKTAIQKRGEKTFWDPTLEERQMEEKGVDASVSSHFCSSAVLIVSHCEVL